MATAITDPIAWALDADGDREILPGSGCRFTYGLEAVLQNVQTALKDVQGEWFLDLLRGVPLFTDVLGVTYDKQKVLGIYRKIIEAVPDVTGVSILTATYTATTRTVVVYFEALTPFGTVTGTV